MSEISNLKELRKRKKELNRKIHNYEEELQGEMDFFQYGVKAAGWFRKYGGHIYFATFFKRIFSKIGNWTTDLLKTIFRSFSRPPLVFFLIGGASLSLLYFLFKGKQEPEADNIDELANDEF